MTDRPETRAARIARSRKALAEAQAANPGAVQAYHAKMMRITSAARRERQRVDHLVLGMPRPVERVSVPGTSRKGKRRPKVIERPVTLEPGIEEAVQLRERWSHKQGTAETHDVAGTHCDSLDQLERNGTIDKDQRECAAQIANVHRSIEADVGVRSASLEARVDNSSRPVAVAERIHRVRMHLAYTYWRELLPAPKGLVLDMIVGDTIGYTVAAGRYRVHKRRAKRLLLEAIARWPACVAAAFSVVDQADVDAMNEARQPGGYVRMHPYSAAPMDPVEASYDHARAIEAGRQAPNEPYLLPAIDPAFLDERGHVLPWARIAAVVRERVAAMYDEAA